MALPPSRAASTCCSSRAGVRPVPLRPRRRPRLAARLRVAVGLDDFLAKRASNVEAGTNLLLRLFLLVFGLAAVVLWISWKWGGCSVAGCARISPSSKGSTRSSSALAAPTLWEKVPLPAMWADGTGLRRSALVAAGGAGRWGWRSVGGGVAGPAAAGGDLCQPRQPELHAQIQTVLPAIVTTALSRTLFARHLFCCYMCSWGVPSLI